MLIHTGPGIGGSKGRVIINSFKHCLAVLLCASALAADFTGLVSAADEYNKMTNPQLLVIANDQFKRQHYPQAIRICDLIIERSPGEPQAYVLKANCLDDASQAEPAMAVLEQFNRTHPPDPSVLNQLGTFYTNQKQYDKALGCYSAAIKANPRFEDAYHRRSIVYSTLKRYDESIADMTTWIKLKPSNGRGYEWRAAAYQQSGQWAKAIADLTRAIQLNTRNTGEFMVVRADLYMKLKDYKHALADYEAVLKASPMDDTIWFKKGQVLMQLKDYNGAVDAFSATLDFNELSTAYYARSQAYEKLNNHEAAAKDKLAGDKLAKKRAIDRI